MTPTYDASSDALLQELYSFAYSTAPCPRRLAQFDRDRLLPFVQACGIAYERDFTSLIPDRAYDALAQLLGDPAGSAMGWRKYPDEAGALATRLAGAQAWRAHYLELGGSCAKCRWSWDPDHACDCRWMEAMG